jgi:hypothetical protein
VLEDSYHIVTLDRQRQVVVERSVAFGNERARAHAGLLGAASLRRSETRTAAAAE